jgi:hypothetical protein
LSKINLIDEAKKAIKSSIEEPFLVRIIKNTKDELFNDQATVTFLIKNHIRFTRSKKMPGWYWISLNQYQQLENAVRKEIIDGRFEEKCIPNDDAMDHHPLLFRGN